MWCNSVSNAPSHVTCALCLQLKRALEGCVCWDALTLTPEPTLTLSGGCRAEDPWTLAARSLWPGTTSTSHGLVSGQVSCLICKEGSPWTTREWCGWVCVPSDQWISHQQGGAHWHKKLSKCLLFYRKHELALTCCNCSSCSYWSWTDHFFKPFPVEVMGTNIHSSSFCSKMYSNVYQAKWFLIWVD